MPNSISGPLGSGANDEVAPDEPLPYTIDFTNLPAATSPPSELTITIQLDPTVDWETFRLGDFFFGGQSFSVPANVSSYTTTINRTMSLGYDIDFSASVDAYTGVVTWTLTATNIGTGVTPDLHGAINSTSSYANYSVMRGYPVSTITDNNSNSYDYAVNTLDTWTPDAVAIYEVSSSSQQYALDAVQPSGMGPATWSITDSNITVSGVSGHTCTITIPASYTSSFTVTFSFGTHTSHFYFST